MSRARRHLESTCTPRIRNRGEQPRFAFAMRTALMLFLGTVLGLTFPTNAAKAASVGEQKLKAAFLYNFTKFIEWPPERFADATDPIVIGLLADASMLTEVTSVTASRHVNGRPLAVRLVDDATDLQATHVLFVAAHEQPRYAKLRKHLDAAAALVVGDSADCARHGASICFVQQGEKLRFEIHIGTAERARLKVSAQLQKLAVVVHRGT